MDKQDNDSVSIWKQVWSIILVAIGICFIIAISEVYSNFKSELSGTYAPIVWIVVIFTIVVSGTCFFTAARILLKRFLRKDLVPQIRGKGRIAWIIGWSIWHVLLGLGLIAIMYYLADQLSSQITEQYLLMAYMIGISFIGFGVMFLISAIKSFVGLGRKIKDLTLPPAMATIGLAFLLLIPSIGLYYYMGIYLPEQKYTQPMDRGPFLFWRNDTTSTMVIAWDSVTSASYKVKWGTSPSDLNQESIPDSYPIYAPSSGAWDSGTPIGYRYYVELTGLNADTKYYYTIPNFIDKTYSFKTGPSTTRPFSFQVIGDTRRPDTRHPQLVNLMLTEYDSDFVINVGDTCNNELLDWNQFFDEIRYQANERPYLVAVGNHEYGNEFGYYFNYKFTPEHYYYSINYSNAHFLFIDCFDGSGGYVSQEQKAFIEDDLKRNAGKHDWIIASFHVPIFSTGDFNYDPQREADFMPLFTKYGVDIVFTGHDHHYEAFNITRSILESKFGPYNSTSNGMMHFVCGGGGSPLDIPLCMNREVDPWQELYHNSSNPDENWQKYMPKGATAETANYTVSEIQIYGELTWQFIQVNVDGPKMNITA
ncbi:MAG: metallophosphoesterase, partial [Promethearchaeota archaeon]